MCICSLCPCYSVHRFESQHGSVEVKVKTSTIVNILNHIWHNDFNVSNDVIFYFGIYEKHQNYIIKDKTPFVENNNTFILYSSL